MLNVTRRDAMSDLSEPVDPEELPPEPTNLRFLRILVTVLTAVMIGGLVVLIAVLVTRLKPTALVLPDSITLPDGAEAQSFTIGSDWFAVVTTDNRILILDRDTGAVRQTVQIEAR